MKILIRTTNFFDDGTYIDTKFTQPIPTAKTTLFYSNLGWYGNNFKDEDLYDLVKKLGAAGTRPSLPDIFLETNGITSRISAFKHAKDNGIGLVLMVGWPANDHVEKKTYGTAVGARPSLMFDGIYLSKDDPKNFYAAYIKSLQSNGYLDNVTYLEVINEPDFASNTANNSQWLTRLPDPQELSNLNCPVQSFIRLLRITKELCPTINVVPGGLGYVEFLDVLCRTTDNPIDGSVTSEYPLCGIDYMDAVSVHNYPEYYAHKWNGNGFTYTRHSDWYANEFISYIASYANILHKHSKIKNIICTEIGIGSKNSISETSLTNTIESQLNFTIKILATSAKIGLSLVAIFNLGDIGQKPNSYDVFDSYGMYSALDLATPTTATLKPAGKGFQFIAKNLAGWSCSVTQCQKMEMPTNCTGIAFALNGSFRYILWANTSIDQSEQALVSYTVPFSMFVSNMNIHHYDGMITPLNGPINLTGTPIILF